MPNRNTPLISQKITREIRKCLEENEHKNTTYEDIWGAVNAVPRGKFIAVNVRF